MGLLDDFLSRPDQEPEHYDPVSLLWRALPGNVKDAYASLLGGNRDITAKQALLGVANMTPMGGLKQAVEGTQEAFRPRSVEEGPAGWDTASNVLKATLGAMAVAAPRVAPPTRSTNLVNLRGLPTEEAIKIARTEPHLIPAGEQSESAYVGAPRNVQSRADLLRNRRAVDRGIDAGQFGGDWYDRYRASMGEVTGNDPMANRWMASQEGQWSAGVSPESELQFALKENTGSLAGMPVKSARPAQHEAHQAAIAAEDPRLYQLGEKTGEYAKRIEPIQEGGLLGAQNPMIGHNKGPPLDDMPARTGGATGVNDFRWAAEHGFTEPDGAPQKNALTDAQHRFLDYETALAVDRANKRAAGGRTNWTGEQVQAAGWVRQKADDILAQRPSLVQDRYDAIDKQAQAEGWDAARRNAARKQARSDADAEAFSIANRQIGDYFDKHQAFATHESRPGSLTGHMPSLLSPADVAAYHADPASTWATAPGGRDAIYGDLRIPGTGVSPRVRPTVANTGNYTPEGGPTEFNPGATARPLVAFDAPPNAPKVLSPADRAVLQAGETTRAAIDAQNAGAAHKVWLGGPVGQSNSLWVPMNRKLTPAEIQQLMEHGAKNGLPHVVDTGVGATITNFDDAGPPLMSAKDFKNHAAAVSSILPDAKPAMRSKVDSVYAGLEPQWKQGAGSRAVTQEMLDKINATPALRAAFNQSTMIPERAGAKMKRDVAMGGARPDIQNLRDIISRGPGWVKRVEDAVRRGEYLPALLAAPGLGGLLAARQPEDRSQAY